MKNPSPVHCCDFCRCAVLAVDEVVNGGAVRQGDLPKVAQYVVTVAGHRAAGLGRRSGLSRFRSVRLPFSS